jgi:hypothetical protein
VIRRENRRLPAGNASFANSSHLLSLWGSVLHRSASSENLHRVLGTACLGNLLQDWVLNPPQSHHPQQFGPKEPSHTPQASFKSFFIVDISSHTSQTLCSLFLCLSSSKTLSMATKADIMNDSKLRQRKLSVGTTEINGPDAERIVILDELNGADAELAAKFGYKPVFKRVNMFP